MVVTIREVVKYQNRFNKIGFGIFNRPQANIFFAIISRLRNKQSTKVTISYKKLAQLSGVHYGRRIGYFDKKLKDTYHKILHLSVYHEDKNEFDEINLFSRFRINKKRQICTIEVNPAFTGLLNNIAKKFTRFSLRSYTNLRNKYCKSLFRLISQFRMTGNVYLPLKKFRRLLNVPKSYRNTDIVNKIILPAKLQLTPLVRGLHIIVQRKSSGNRITGFHITFTPITKPNNDFDIRTRKQIKKTMIQNVKLNGWLSPKLKTRSLSHLIRRATKKPKKHPKEPMKVFNRMLKNASLEELHYYLYLHKIHSVTINMSEYQVKKLRDTIKKRSSEDRNKVGINHGRTIGNVNKYDQILETMNNILRNNNKRQFLRYVNSSKVKFAINRMNKKRAEELRSMIGDCKKMIIKKND